MQTIGKYSYKPYQCDTCGQEKELGTNHWGECYPVCDVCGKQTIWKCLEPVPEGFTKPDPWNFVKLGDVADILVERIITTKEDD